MSCTLESMTPEKIVEAIENKEFVWKKEYSENLVKRFEVAREFLLLDCGSFGLKRFG